MFNSWDIVVILVGYLLSVFGGYIITDPIIRNLVKRYLSKSIKNEINKQGILPILTGMIDRFLFTTVYLLEYPEFIAVWIVIRFAGAWSPSKDMPLYYIFQVGMALELIISIGTAIGISLLINQ